jgi:hypothetical protein
MELPKKHFMLRFESFDKTSYSVLVPIEEPGKNLERAGCIPRLLMKHQRALEHLGGQSRVPNLFVMVRSKVHTYVDAHVSKEDQTALTEVARAETDTPNSEWTTRAAAGAGAYREDDPSCGLRELHP